MPYLSYAGNDHASNMFDCSTLTPSFPPEELVKDRFKQGICPRPPSSHCASFFS